MSRAEKLRAKVVVPGNPSCLELVRDRKTKEPAIDEAKNLVKFCRENGLILLICGRYSNVIRTLMPLVMTEDQLDEGLSILEKGFASMSQG